ncbi:uncharacterized protein LOC111099536 isoform X3 [Crassostrea virginica]
MMAFMNALLKGFMILYFARIFVNADDCIVSKSTVKKVKSCPQNAEEWGNAADKKGCEKVNNSFIYHCVMNTWRNETVEVCALAIRIEKFARSTTSGDVGFNAVRKIVVMNVQYRIVPREAIYIKGVIEIGLVILYHQQHIALVLMLKQEKETFCKGIFLLQNQSKNQVQRNCILVFLEKLWVFLSKLVRTNILETSS